jgi:hypothetical protein
MADSKGCAFELTNLQVVRITLLFLNSMASSILRCTVILDFRTLLREKLGEKLLLLKFQEWLSLRILFRGQRIR